MAYRLTVDPDFYMSSGECVADAPELLRFDEEEMADVGPGAPVPADQVAGNLARACPSSAIQVFDGEDEVSVF